MIVDFGSKRLKWKHGAWTDVFQKRPNGHYLLNLADNLKQLKARMRQPDFAHYPEELDKAILSLGIADEGPSWVEGADESSDDILSTGVPSKTWKKIDAARAVRVYSLFKRSAFIIY